MQASSPPRPPTIPQRLAEREHPAGSAVMHQRWENLLFLHWRWDPVAVQRALPPGLTVDTYHGGAWLGLSPVTLRDVRPRFVPPLPFLSDFFELNLRTYVHDAQSRPGVYFFSLDCSQPLVVEAARRLLLLRYEHSVIEAAAGPDGTVDFASRRAGADRADVFRYRAVNAERTPDNSSLEFFLLERYRLFTEDVNGRPASIRLHHLPYRVRDAEVMISELQTPALAGFDPRGRAPDHACCAIPLDVEIFLPELEAKEED